MAHPLFRANQQKNEAKRKAKHPARLNFAKTGLPDQRTAGFGTSDQKTDIRLRKTILAWPFACENRFDRQL